MDFTVSISLVDREGNKKAISIGDVPDAAIARVAAFCSAIQALTGCKILGYGYSKSFVYVGGTFTPGTFDLVGEVANLRLKRISDGQAFQFKVPGAINGAYDEEEEVTPEFANDVISAIETFIGVSGNYQYRGGRLITKEVSPPVKIPDLES